MATVQTNKSPIHETCVIGQPYGNQSSSYACGYHTGCDFPQSGVTTQNPDLYCVVEDGEVVYTYTQATGNGGSPSLGNQVQIKDRRTGNFYRYCHLYPGSVSVSVGDIVNLSTKIGKMRKHREFYGYTFTP